MTNTATLLTRRQVAALLGVSESEVKARDNVALHPIKARTAAGATRPRKSPPSCAAL